MRIIIGIGNPGIEYQSTRHNVGWRVVECVARELGLVFRPEDGPALVARGEDIVGPFGLMKPLGYVNRTGQTLRNWERTALIEAPCPLVVVDDLALDVGAVRFRVRGGHGGHNGLRSLIETLGTEDFPRIRLGIGQVPPSEWRDHVLSPFQPSECVAMQGAVRGAVSGVIRFLRGDGPLEFKQ